jgi:hypothetical protein
MTERWIDDAVEDGREEKARLEALAAQAEIDRANFKAEDVSDEALATYLRRFEAPVLQVVAELQRRNYAVEASRPGMIFDSSTWRAARINLTDYSRGQALGRQGDENHIFGRCWKISSPNEGLLGDVRIYLKARRDVTHFAGADFLESSPFSNKASKEPGVLRHLIMPIPHINATLEGTEFGLAMAEHLRGVVGSWISNAQIPHELRNQR